MIPKQLVLLNARRHTLNEAVTCLTFRNGFQHFLEPILIFLEPILEMKRSRVNDLL